MEPVSINSYETKLLTLSGTLVTREMQLKLMHDVVADNDLLKSNILSSVSPRIGKKFHYLDLQLKLEKILLEARSRILIECSMVEADRDIVQLCEKTSKILNSTKEDSGQTMVRVTQHKEKLRSKLRARHQKKQEFHSKKRLNKACEPAPSPGKRNKHRKETKEAKKKIRK